MSNKLFLMLKSKKKWTDSEIAHLEKYVATHSDKLTGNLYKNILVGYIRFTKPYGFFTGLSRLLKRSRAQCQAKFYQLEAELYVELLLISCADFCLFANIRQRKYENRDFGNYVHSQEDIDILSKKDESLLLVETPSKSQKSKEEGGGPQSGMEEEMLRRMSDDEIKQRRRKVMQRYLDRTIKLTFKNKG